MIPWLDRVPALPTVGLHFKAWFKSRDAVFDRLAPLLTRWDGERQVLAFTEHGPIGLRVDSTAGFAVLFDLLNVNIMSESNVQHASSGHDPTAGPAIPGRTFSLALAEVLEVAGEVVKHMIRDESRPLVRAGLIASSRLERVQLPPGIAQWPEELGRPWGGALTAGQGRFTASAGAGEGYKDRCHHVVRFEDTDTKPVTLQLDWQRTYDPAQDITSRNVTARLSEWSRAAVVYFERLGEGLAPGEREPQS